MIEEKKTSEIINSLDKFVEKQKYLLEKENQLLLEKGKKEFEEIIVKKKKHLTKDVSSDFPKNHSWRFKIKQLSDVWLVIKKYVSKLLRKIKFKFRLVKSKFIQKK